MCSSDLKQALNSIIDETVQHQSTNVMPVKYESFADNITIGESSSNDNDIQEATEYEESTLSISEVEKWLLVDAGRMPLRQTIEAPNKDSLYNGH